MYLRNCQIQENLRRMKVKVEKTEPCRVLLNVEIPEETVRKEHADLLSRVKNIANVPGFRRGKAPANLVASHYRREMEKQIADIIVADTLPAAIKEANVEPVVILHIGAKINDNQTMHYQALLDVAPTFKLPRYKGIPVKPANTQVTDEAVEKAFQNLLKDFQEYDEISDQPVAENDIVSIDYAIANGAEPPPELEQSLAYFAKGANRLLKVQPEVFLPGLDKALIGMKTGENRPCTITFPSDFEAKALAGKTLAYTVTVRKVRRPRPPAVTEKVLKAMDAADETQLRAKVREIIQRQTEKAEHDRQIQEIGDYLVSKTEMDIPKSLVAEQTYAIFESMVRRMLFGGIPMEEIKRRREEFMQTSKEKAVSILKLNYICHRIAKAENIAVSDEELDAKIAELAKVHGLPPEELRKKLTEKEELDRLRQDILVIKVMEFLLANSRPPEEGFFSRIFGGARKSSETPAGDAPQP